MSSTTMSEKIRKLMAMADHPGTGANEAAVAAAMAAELALKYNIDLASIGGAEEKARKKFHAGDYANTKVIPRDKGAHMLLAAGVSKLYGCKFLILTRHNSNHIRFVGQEHNVLLCNRWLEYLWEACGKSVSAYHKTRSYENAKARYKAELAFRLQFAGEVYRRLGDKLQAMQREGVGSSGTALMVVNWYETEQREVQAWMEENIRFGKPTATRRKTISDVHASQAGYHAGQKVGLSDQVTASAAPQARIK